MAETTEHQEETLQLRISSSLKKRIKRHAVESDVTIRAFVLRAIKQQGVAVTDADLCDRRKRRSK